MGETRGRDDSRQRDDDGFLVKPLTKIGQAHVSSVALLLTSAIKARRSVEICSVTSLPASLAQSLYVHTMSVYRSVSSCHSRVLLKYHTQKRIHNRRPMAKCCA